MNQPLLVTTEARQDMPALLIDKKGILGKALSEKLREEFLVVFVSQEPPEQTKNIIHIPYRKKIPVIPDHGYSYVFCVYNGEKELLEILPSLIKKAEQDKAKIVFITDARYGSPYLFKKMPHTYHKLAIVLYGQLFGGEETKDNPLSSLLASLKEHGQVDVPNNGFRKLYPVLLDDVVSGIITAAFASQNAVRTFLLFPRYPLTEISVVRILQKINPGLSFHFTARKEKEIEYYFPNESEYLFSEYSLEDKLKKLSFLKTIPQHSAKTYVHRASRRRKLSLKIPIKGEIVKNHYFLAGIGLIGIFLFPLLFAGLSYSLAGLALKISLNSLSQGNLVSAQKYASFSQKLFTTTQGLTNTLVMFDVVGKNQKDAFLTNIEMGKDASYTELDVLYSIGILQNIFQGRSLNPKVDFVNALSRLKNTMITLQRMRAEDKLPKSMVVKLDSLETSIEFFENTIDTWPMLLGFNGTRTYLILFQNNMELRPGGGFIGSYGIVQLLNGRLNKFSINDVYDADGKLIAHIDPPFLLQRYLGASHLFLRDSNYGINFTDNALRAEDMLHLETGQKVDGVIAIDTDFVKAILEALGPVPVEDYKETVNADNFYLLTQTHTEKDFFPGSTQKKDFLRSFYNSLLSQIMNKKRLPYLPLIKKSGELAQEKHLLFYFNDKSIETLFTVNNLSSSLWTDDVVKGNAVSDFLGINEANLGTNKANYYIMRSIEHMEKLTDDGSIVATITILYQNSSKQDSRYGGDYKNYLRFILPSNARLQSISIDDKDKQITQAITDERIYTRKNFIPPKELEVEATQTDDKNIFGFLLTVPASTSKKVDISYILPNIIDMTQASFVYNLHLFKQPGTENDSYLFSFSYPSNFTITDGPSDLVKLGSKVNWESILNQDKLLRITFSQK